MSPGAEPGTSGANPYCLHKPSGGANCYPTEAQRSAAAQADIDAQVAEEAAREKAWRVEQDQKAADEIAATTERERKLADYVAERDRKDAARVAAEAEQVASLRAMALDKSYAAPAISAIMCAIERELSALRADLAHENRVTAVSGVVNLSVRNDIASTLVDDTDELGGWRRALARYGASRVPCKDVKVIEGCHQNIDNCQGKTRDIAHVWISERGTLWGSSNPPAGR